MNRICLLIVVLFLTGNAYAQSPQDTIFQDGKIRKYPGYFALRTTYQERQLGMVFSPENQPEAEAYYVPSNIRTLGIGFHMLGVGFTYSFLLPQNFQPTDKPFNPDQRDTRLNLYRSRWGLQLDLQRYIGYYLKSTTLDPEGTQPDSSRTDIATSRTLVGVTYMLKPEEFSYSAAQSNSKRQTEGGGTFLARISAGKFGVSADSALLAPEPDGRELTSFDTYSFSVLPGYAHTFVFRKIYVMGSLTLGPELQRTTSNLSRNIDWDVQARLQFQFTLGFDNDRFFSNITYLSQRQRYFGPGLYTDIGVNSIRLSLGHRFRELGFMHRIRSSVRIREWVHRDR